MIRLFANAIKILLLGFLVFLFIVVCMLFSGCDNPQSKVYIKPEVKKYLQLKGELDRSAIQAYQYKERYLNKAWFRYLSKKITFSTYEKIVLCVTEDYHRKIDLINHDRDTLLK